MGDSTPTTEDLAAELREAEISRVPIAPLTERFSSMTVADAHAVHAGSLYRAIQVTPGFVVNAQFDRLGAVSVHLS